MKKAMIPSIMVQVRRIFYFILYSDEQISLTRNLFQLLMACSNKMCIFSALLRPCNGLKMNDHFSSLSSKNIHASTLMLGFRLEAQT
jgi:hypothetical protein